MKRKRRFGRGLPLAFQKTAKSLSLPGEAGRAIPGEQQAHAEEGRKNITSPPAIIPPAVGRTEISTYQTRAGGDFLMYEADGWVRVGITLITAGPVDIGTREKISPVLSGKGGSLITGEAVIFDIKKGERIFVTAGSVNRVRLIVGPVPYGEQILGVIGSTLALMKKVLR